MSKIDGGKAADELNRSSPAVFQRRFGLARPVLVLNTQRQNVMLLDLKESNCSGTVLCSSGWCWRKLKLLASARCRKYYFSIFFLTKLDH